MASVAAAEHVGVSFDHDEVLEMMDVSQIVDGALLMELLDEYSQSQPEEKGEDDSAVQPRAMEAADRTTHAGVRCPPASLGSDGAGGILQDSIHPHDEYCEDCGLDDILSDLHCCDCASSTSAPMSSCLLVDDDYPPYPVDWSEMETAASPSNDIGEWYVDDSMHGCGMYFVHGDLEGYSSLLMQIDDTVDQSFYSSLWE